MQAFADYLNDYIKRKGLSYRKAAEMCCMDRSQLKRYVDGKRLPRDETIVIKIAQGLQMPSEDTIQIRKEYSRSKIGEDQYAAYKMISRIYEGVYEDKKIADNDSGPDEKIHSKGVEYLYSNHEIFRWIYYICKDVKHIYVEMNPQYQEIMEIMKQAAKDNRDCSIEHLIVVNSFVENGEVEDIQNFEQLFSCMLVHNLYKIYHRYKKMPGKAEEVLTYNYILTELGMVIFCDCITDKKKFIGCFISEPDVLSYYAGEFRRKISRSYLYAMNGNWIDFTYQWDWTEGCVCNEETGVTMEIGSRKRKKSICIGNPEHWEKSILVEEGNIVGLFEDFILNVEVIRKII